MAISRPFLLALLGVALLGATVFAVQNARNQASDDKAAAVKPSVPAPAPSSPEPAQATAAKLSAKEAVASILSPGDSVDSARFSLRYNLREFDDNREHDYGTVSGQFVSKGDSVADFDFRMRTHDDAVSGKGATNENVHLVVAGGKAYVGEGDKLFQTSDAALENISAVRRSIAGSPVAKMKPFDLSRWLKDVKVAGVEKVDGVDATHVTGKLVAADATRDVFRLVRAEAVDANGNANLPAHGPKKAGQAVKSAKFDAWVGPDRIMRRMTLSVQLDIPKSLATPGDGTRGSATLDVRMSDVNKVDSVQVPSDVSAGAPAKGMGARDAKTANNLLAVTGLLVDAPGGVTGAGYSFLRLARVGNSTQVAKKVLRTVKQHKPVVVFFHNPLALDDRATAASVSYLKSHAKKLAVFSDNVQNTKSYGKLLENLGVTQAPAIVFINRRGTASLIEGYVDGPSLAQVIADAR
ncbi:MAG TPA: hypothetical protein VJT68_04910 [Thermoleophilaceae bacterium]|nr:hypothetical protein [Thermoleophilaceae bacterium]